VYSRIRIEKSKSNFKIVSGDITSQMVQGRAWTGPGLDRLDPVLLGPGPGPPAVWTGPEGQGQVQSK